MIGVNKFNRYGKKSFIDTKNNIIKVKNNIVKRHTEKNQKELIKDTRKGIKNTKKIIKNVDKVSKETAKNTKKVLQVTKNTVKVTYQSLKTIIKVTISTIKTIILGTKALIELLIAGGWIVVVIIIVICMIGWLCNSVYGIFFTNEKSENNLDMSIVINEISNDINNKIEDIKKNNIYDECSINSNISNWKEILTFYSVKSFTENNDVITLDQNKVNEIKKIFWEFNIIESDIKEETKDNNIIEVLYIEIKSKSITEMENKYNFSTSQREQITELLSDEYSSLWSSVITGSVNEQGWIFPVKDFYVITTYYSDSHKAIDIASSYNTNIYSITNGTVILAKDGCVAGNITCNGKAGNYIVISHDDGKYYSQYMHLNKINVKVGDKVNVGDVIATMGNTGNVLPVPSNSLSTVGTHLHFVIQDESPSGRFNVDPNLFYSY